MASASSSRDPWPVPSGRPVSGQAAVPGSKSWTHRAYARAFLAEAPVRVVGALRAEDTDLFLKALEQCGFRVRCERTEVWLEPPKVWPRAASFFCGNAGTLLRLLLGLVATRPGLWHFDGTERLRQRPVGPLLAALGALGIEVRYWGTLGSVPLEIESRGLQGGAVRLSAVESSQYLSALLFAGQAAAGALSIAVDGLSSEPYVAMTEAAIRDGGGSVFREGPNRWRTEPARICGGTVWVEADCSAAAYPAAAAAVTGGEILIAQVPAESFQGDRKFLDLLSSLGAEVETVPEGVRVRGRSLVGGEVDLNGMPDQVPTLAAVAPFASGVTRIRNVAHLRLKESDRLAVTRRELTRVGVPARELPDGLEIPGIWSGGVPKLPPVVIDPEGDHRIAMAFAVLGLRRGGVAIAHPEVVEKSFPSFFEELEQWTAGRG